MSRLVCVVVGGQLDLVTGLHVERQGKGDSRSKDLGSGISMMPPGWERGMLGEDRDALGDTGKGLGFFIVRSLLFISFLFSYLSSGGWQTSVVFYDCRSELDMRLACE